ncbi:conserved hypothetical protein [Trichinella spiralis]|uniref:hypothetical protein n=1 Tax=Trichinella spiralis TaxID=6334 RepID=UPI0001EFC321|nr:conserved hypothetical protein [Trichinella spiralis]
MAFSTQIDLFCVKFFVEDQQQFVHWKRPLVRIPLMVDMVVCTLLQSEPTKMLKYAFALLQCCHYRYQYLCTVSLNSSSHLLSNGELLRTHHRISNSHITHGTRSLVSNTIEIFFVSVQIQLVPTKLLLKIDRNANEVVCILRVSFVCKSINSYRGMPIINALITVLH